MSSLLMFESHFHREIKLRIYRYLTCYCPSEHNVLIMNIPSELLSVKLEWSMHVYTVFNGFDFFLPVVFMMYQVQYYFGYPYIIYMGKNTAKRNFCEKICLWMCLKIWPWQIILVILDLIFFRRVKYNNKYFA